MSNLKYDHISELNAVTEFENWFINLYGAYNLLLNVVQKIALTIHIN
jgi:hypothetical protein